jgi:mannose-6-phosphate isomerase-like protein (cupin superfamily)
MSVWKTKAHKKLKPWGGETQFGSPFGMSGKIISLQANKRTSLKYYKTKNQLMYCLSGRVSIFAPNEREFGDIRADEGNYFELAEGDIILIQAANPYRIRALEDSKLVEVIVGPQGYSEKDFIMLEDDFGRNIEKVESFEPNN